MTRLDRKMTLDDLLPTPGPDRGSSEFVRRRFNELWARLQPLASAAEECYSPEPVDPAEFTEPPRFDYTFELTERQQRAFARTSWILDRAREAAKVWIFAQPSGGNGEVRSRDGGIASPPSAT